MKARGHLRAGAALVRARLPWVAFLVPGAGLYPRTLPEGAALPGMGLVLCGAVLALLFTTGTVAGEGRTGAALLWIQKPGRPAVYWGGRLAVVVALVVVAHALGGLALILAGLVATAPSGGAVMALALADLAVVAVAFAVAAAGIRMEAVVSVVIVLALAGLGTEAVASPGAFGAWGPWLAALRFPVLELQALRLWVDGSGTLPAGSALLRVALYPAAWSGAGLALVELRTSTLIPGWPPG